MNIRDSMKQNLIDLEEFLHETAALDTSQLGSEWESRKVAIEKHAIYLKTFTIPDMIDKAMIAEFVPPKRKDQDFVVDYNGPLVGEELAPNGARG